MKDRGDLPTSSQLPYNRIDSFASRGEDLLANLESRSREFSRQIRWQWKHADHSTRCCVIALHGMGQDGSSILKRLEHLASRGADIVVPDGPHLHEVRGRDGTREGHSWYIYTGDQPRFRESLIQSESDLLGIVDTVQRESGISSEKTVLLGFSQGGYLAGFVSCRHRNRFGNCVIASARLKHEFLGDEISSGDLPTILFLHDDQDPLTGPEPVKESIQQLKQAEADVEVSWHSDGHRLGDQSISALQRWLEQHDLIE
ncbi:MAG TPA: hypothetical protein EYQ08_04210 [Planctomycetes bacterium]|nr:hypothetical protein [Planctomycetota bacterium]HIK82479.1 hypothetical protein [Planctomycetota bacterium]